MNNNRWIFLFPFFLVLYEFTVYLSNDLIMPGMIQVVHEFNAGKAFVPNSLTAFLLGGASLQIILGPFSDSFGRRKVMLFGAYSFLFSTLFILFSHSISQFIIGRFFQGMGLCYIGAVGYASIQEMYPEKRAVKIISLMAIVALLAPLMGPFLGGIYTHFFNWRGIFVIITFLMINALIGLHISMPETAHLKLSIHNVPMKKPDLKLLPKFSFQSFVKNYSLILRNKKFMCGSIALSLSNGPLLAWIAVSPLILISKAHLSSALYGVLQIPIFGSLILGNIVLQRMLIKFSLNKIAVIGSIIIVFGLFLCGFCSFYFGESYLNILIPFSIYSFGEAITNSTLTRLILFSSPVAKGTVSATLSLINTSILSCCTFLMTWVYKSQHNLNFAIFSAVVGVFFIPFIVLFLVKNKSDVVNTN